MEKIVIKGRRREEMGTRAAQALRAQGLVPVVLYGREDGKTLHLSLETKAVEKMLRGHARVVEVDLDDGTKESGLVKDVQFDPVTDQVLHMDLIHVDLTKPVEVEVPLEFVGHPKGISEGGKFTHDLADLPLVCLP
ncbi:MAG TPA: 50S ribosomal protein L25, partial [Planctomycetes bacterium]|nr:50S ribosomal protein L25 [Planctomycetota bacterium]